MSQALATGRIERPSLHAGIMARVRTMLIEGRWEAGARVPEVELAAELGVSRTPLREALKVLASEGLVELLPSRGAVVKAFTAAEAADILQCLGYLEARAAQLMCDRAPAPALQAILRMHADMRGRFEARDRGAYFALNQQIHDAIVAAAGSPTLAELHRMLSQRVKRLRFQGSHTSAHWQEAMAEHEAMAEAMAARDGARLAALLEAHQRSTWQRIRPSLPSAKS
ncbi:MAG: GntR family transcriptional regulator [Acetobacteraceae bacterium]